MVILSKNPFETEPEKLNTIEVEKLLLRGENYKSLSENPIKQVIRGILK